MRSNTKFDTLQNARPVQVPVPRSPTILWRHHSPSLVHRHCTILQPGDDDGCPQVRSTDLVNYRLLYAFIRSRVVGWTSDILWFVIVRLGGNVPQSRTPHTPPSRASGLGFQRTSIFLSLTGNEEWGRIRREGAIAVWDLFTNSVAPPDENLLCSSCAYRPIQRFFRSERK